MKKILTLALASIMLISLFGCSGGGDTQSQADNNPSSQQVENERSKATEFTFALAAEEERVVENLIFDEDVTISGDFGIIVFENCEFNGDIINAASLVGKVDKLFCRCSKGLLGFRGYCSYDCRTLNAVGKSIRAEKYYAFGVKLEVKEIGLYLCFVTDRANDYVLY